MKNKPVKPARGKFTILNQVCNLIPPHLVPKIARQTKVDEQARAFSPWSHTVTLMQAQLSHCISLNDVCDGLQLRRGALSAIRGAIPPSRNGFSHANRQSSPDMAEQVFWGTLEHLKNNPPASGPSTAGAEPPPRRTCA